MVISNTLPVLHLQKGPTLGQLLNSAPLLQHMLQLAAPVPDPQHLITHTAYNVSYFTQFQNWSRSAHTLQMCLQYATATYAAVASTHHRCEAFNSSQLPQLQLVRNTFTCSIHAIQQQQQLEKPGAQ